MSDFLRHECGVAMIRLRKPLSYFKEKYGSALHPFHLLFLLMEKQHNRGHDGFGIGCLKLNMLLGQPYIFRERSSESDSLADLFRTVYKNYGKKVRKGLINENDPDQIKDSFDFGGEVLLGHLRYGTSGAIGRAACHPYLRRSNWPTKTLMVLGNFNMANARELNQKLVERGQHPVFETDTQTVLEEIGFHLDEEHTEHYRRLRDQGVPGAVIPQMISREMNVAGILKRSAEIWDGGYTILGAVGNGDAFAMRDPLGIRPCFYTVTDEFIAFASERVPLMTVFSVEQDQVEELPPGHVATITHDGAFRLERFSTETPPLTRCSFESIYFSRGNDPGIYQQRKRLGAIMVPTLMEASGGDMEKTVLSFIPNTAEVAYQGLVEAFRAERNQQVKSAVLGALEKGELNESFLDRLLRVPLPRAEKIAHKDIKLRTFISQEASREQLASHVYDVTYGVVGPEDCLIVMDDSIVRGTTLRQSILKILTRVNPRKIIIASTAPQIRYPDCYGIDMAELGRFIAFQAAIELLRDTRLAQLIEDTYSLCLEELKKPVSEQRNVVKDIYQPFTDDEISARIGKMVYPKDTNWRGDVEVVYQKVSDLHKALGPGYGDWYFTGNYPTPAGVSVANRAFVDFYEKRQGRPYDLFG